jgi:hypothetical protein
MTLVHTAVAASGQRSAQVARARVDESHVQAGTHTRRHNGTTDAHGITGAASTASVCGTMIAVTLAAPPPVSRAVAVAVAATVAVA